MAIIECIHYSGFVKLKVGLAFTVHGTHCVYWDLFGNCTALPRRLTISILFHKADNHQGL